MDGSHFSPVSDLFRDPFHADLYTAFSYKGKKLVPLLSDDYYYPGDKTDQTGNEQHVKRAVYQNSLGEPSHVNGHRAPATTCKFSPKFHSLNGKFVEWKKYQSPETLVHFGHRILQQVRHVLSAEDDEDDRHAEQPHVVGDGHDDSATQIDRFSGSRIIRSLDIETRQTDKSNAATRGHNQKCK